MTCSIEISYYPLTQEFKAPIKEFIHRLQNHGEIEVRPGRISTQLFGEYRTLMEVLTEEIERSTKELHSVFVLKILNMDRS